MSFAKDLTGMRFGRLNVISRNYEKQKEYFAKTGNYSAFWNCLCDCGNEVVVRSSSLMNKSNPTFSCGCYRNEILHKQKNTIEIKWMFDGDNIYGITNKGEKFVIDAEDFDRVKDYCWRKDRKGYIIANGRNGSNKIVWLHRIIMRAKDDEIVDHINWDKSNNKKSNLRIATKTQNNINIKRKSNNTSGYTGVSVLKNGKYKSSISINGKKYHLGTFDELKDAVKTRHKAEQILHGEWSGEINRKDFIKLIKSEIRKDIDIG